MIGYAYGIDFARVSGQGLGAVYTVNAVSEPQATEGDLRVMLQALLAERFNLRLRRVVQEVDGYGLSVGKNGSKMKEAMVDQAGPRAACGASSAPMTESFLSATLPFAGVTAITGHAAPLSQLTETLARNLKMPVWDQTGLPGKYDFAFCYAQDLSAELKIDYPSLFTALEDLGLTLKKGRGPLETLVVDRLDPPSEN